MTDRPGIWTWRELRAAAGIVVVWSALTIGVLAFWWVLARALGWA